MKVHSSRLERLLLFFNHLRGGGGVDGARPSTWKTFFRRRRRPWLRPTRRLLRFRRRHLTLRRCEGAADVTPRRGQRDLDLPLTSTSSPSSSSCTPNNNQNPSLRERMRVTISKSNLKSLNRNNNQILIQPK